VSCSALLRCSAALCCTVLCCAAVVAMFDGSKACKCKPGYGSLTGAGLCHQCPVGTYSEGLTMEDCKPCPFGTTSKAGSVTADEDCVPVAQPCPVGQIAPPSAVSAEHCACVPGFGGEYLQPAGLCRTLVLSSSTKVELSR
jgi:hypothetical protein